MNAATEDAWSSGFIVTTVALLAFVMVLVDWCRRRM